MLARALGGVGLIAASGLVWGLIEAHAFTVRRVSAPVLPGGRDPITILHVSDLHLTPSQRDKVAWVRSLAALTPDAIVTTGDNFGHRDALPSVLEALEPFRALPGAFVLGSNDYFGPRPKNPFGYFSGPSRIASGPASLPTEDLVAAFESYGWANLTNTRDSMTVRGTSVDLVGMDDPHIGRDRMPASRALSGDVRLGVVHAPYARALDALSDDGVALALAGHTHGGQVCVPGWGALVTNCDLPTRMAKGLHEWPTASQGDGHNPPMRVHVSAGVGAAPFAPVRFFCRPEATLITLTSVDDRKG